MIAMDEVEIEKHKRPVAPFSLDNIDMSKVDMSKNFDKMIQLEMIRSLRGGKGSTGTITEPKSHTLDVVKLAEQLEKESTALDKAAELLSKRAKPNPFTEIANSKFGEVLGQVAGTIAVDMYRRQMAKQDVAAEEAKQAALLRQQQALQAPALQQRPPPQPQRPALNDMDRKLIEGFTSKLEETSRKMDETNRRIAEFEANRSKKTVKVEEEKGNDDKGIDTDKEEAED